MYEATSQANETPGLEDYLKAIQARKWLVLAFTIAGLILATLLATSRTETYDAEAVVVLRPTPFGSSGSNNRTMVQPNLETEKAEMQSIRIAEAVRTEEALSIDARDLLEELTVQFQPQGQSLDVTFTDSDPDRSAAIVNSFVENYAENRNAKAQGFYDANLEDLATDIDLLEAELADVDAEFEDVTADLQRTFSADEADLRSALQARQQALNQERTAILAELRPLKTERGDLTRERNSLAPPAEVLRTAAVPDSANGLGNSAIQLAGLLAGLLMGVAVAFVLDRLDNTAREESDVELAMGSSVLGTVPPFGFSNRTGASALVMLSSSKSTAVQRARESFRRLRTSLQYLATTDNIHSLLITSAQPGEGKSVTATNLAIALAQGGSPTVLVSADMRRPSIEKLFGISNTEGLSSALQAREVTPPPIVSVGVDNLAVIPSGPTPANPGELLGSARFRDLIRRLEATYEYVVVDTPPVLSAADSIAASASVGGCIVLVDSRRTDTPTLLQVRSDLDRAGARVLGAILNRDRSRDAGIFSRRDRYAYERASKNLVS